MNYLEQIKAIFSNMDAVIELANACDKAYAVGTGNPDWYSPYGIEKSEKIAQNLAAICAVNTGISIIALRHISRRDDEAGPSVSEMAPQIIRNICSDHLDEFEKGLLLRLANCSWNAGQPFRDISSNSLSRIKSMNMFDLLDQAEVEKDWHQIKAAALFLREKLGLLV